MWRFLATLSLLFLSLPVFSNTVVLSGNNVRVDLAGHFEVFHDPSGLLGIDDVVKLDGAGRFEPRPGRIAEGYLSGALWLKFCVQRPASAPRDWLLELRPAILDDVRLYLPKGSGYEARYGGEIVPFYAREVAYRNHVFRMPLPAEPELEIFIRLSTTSSMRVAAEIWQPDAFNDAVTRENIVDGIFCGAVLMLLLLAAVQWIRSPNPLYGLYWLYVVTFTIAYMAFRGYAQQFIFPDSATISDVVANYGISGAMMVNAGLIYRLVEWPPRLQRTAFGFLAACVVIGGFCLMANMFDIGGYLRLRYVLLAGTLSGIFGIILVGTAAGMRARGALLYLLAFTPLVLVTLLFNAGAYGYWTHSLRLDGLWQITTILHAVCIQYAVFTRTLTYQAEKDRAEWRLAALAEEMEQQRQFVSMVSHEIRTPLSIIDGAAQLLQLPGQPAGAQQLHVEKIRSAAQRMSDLLERCLTSDRVSTGDWKLQVAEVDLAAMFAEAVERASQVSSRHHVRVELEDLPREFRCDGTLVRVLIDNLLDNAIKYSPDGGDITLSAWGSETGILTMQVKDRGVGIPNLMADRIFERFYRIGEVKRVAGAGLGLFIVKRVAELHGGSVSCSRRSNGGTTFTVELRQQ